MNTALSSPSPDAQRLEAHQTAAPDEGILSRVLVVIDGLDPSSIPLLYGFDLAEAGGGQLAVLIVIDGLAPRELAFGEQTTIEYLSQEWAEVIKQAHDNAERWIRRMAAQRDLPISVQTETGIVMERILNAAQDASLLIMERLPYSVRRDGLLGSRTARVARCTDKPILLVPHRYEPVKLVGAAPGTCWPLGGVVFEAAEDVAQTLRVPLEALPLRGENGEPPGGHEPPEGQPRDAVTGSCPHAEGSDLDAALALRSRPGTLIVVGPYEHSRLYRLLIEWVTEEGTPFATGPVLLSGRAASSSESQACEQLRSVGGERPAA